MARPVIRQGSDYPFSAMSSSLVANCLHGGGDEILALAPNRQIFGAKFPEFPREIHHPDCGRPAASVIRALPPGLAILKLLERFLQTLIV